MAVYEHGYKPYAGVTTPEWSRFLIIPHHAYRDVFRSKIFVAFFAVCFIYPLVAAILIYLHHNVNAISMLKIGDVRELIPIDASFFLYFVVTQGMLGFFLNLLIGPPLISRDLANNALPLYLSRPFTRTEYVAGKMSVILILLSLITWIPGLLLFLLQAYLEGAGWIGNNLWMAGSIILGSLVWIVVLAFLSQAISAWVKWRVVASAALLAIFFIPAAFGAIINVLFTTRWGNLLSLPTVMKMVWAGLFGLFKRQVTDMQIFIGNDGEGTVSQITLMEPPLWTAWAVLALLCVFCLWLLSRKVRAYEVVK
ncbi:MAG TPA: ABC transporter permease subunit [Pyrinomonadaceae bacterium]|nr:ABC transporter permease subunit [Pyrinomonadaceae bacterium]